MKRIILAPNSLEYALRTITEYAEEADKWQVTISPVKRSLDQNAKMWACLSDISNQVVWHGVKLTADEWKDIMTAGLRRSKVVPGIDGGFVVLGQHTSHMDKTEFSELVELILAFGAEHNVEWTEENKNG